MEFIVGCGVVHYTFRICPISLAAVAVDSCPIWLDTASYEILYPCLGLPSNFSIYTCVSACEAIYQCLPAMFSHLHI